MVGRKGRGGRARHRELASSGKGDGRIGEKCLQTGFGVLPFGVVYPGRCILTFKQNGEVRGEGEWTGIS